jgi:hypothetical protein
MQNVLVLVSILMLRQLQLLRYVLVLVYPTSMLRAHITTTWAVVPACLRHRGASNVEI